MEEIFADPTNASRKRDLGGKDLSPPELLKKIEQVTSLITPQAVLLQLTAFRKNKQRLSK